MILLETPKNPRKPIPTRLLCQVHKHACAPWDKGIGKHHLAGEIYSAMANLLAAAENCHGEGAAWHHINLIMEKAMNQNCLTQAIEIMCKAREVITKEGFSIARSYTMQSDLNGQIEMVNAKAKTKPRAPNTADMMDAIIYVQKVIEFKGQNRAPTAGEILSAMYDRWDASSGTPEPKLEIAEINRQLKRLDKDFPIEGERWVDLLSK